MCYKKICYECKKFTWGGCGKHIEEALQDVPVEDRCVCPREEDDDEEEET